MERYYVKWSREACAYAVFDRETVVEENKDEFSKSGHAILWGTDSPYRDIVESKCNELNSVTA